LLCGRVVIGGVFFVSTDGGAEFTRTVANLPQHPDYLARYGTVNSVSGKEGDVWLTTQGGLYHSTDRGHSFAKLKDIGTTYALGLGKSAPDADYPALFLAGTIRSDSGLFRSTDGGKSWSRVNSDQQQFGGFEQVQGDPRLPGRVYLGTLGRGILYGDPN
jgi:xyloglucan-specific exo-beta-1,4-glucanase